MSEEELSVDLQLQVYHSLADFGCNSGISSRRKKNYVELQKRASLNKNTQSEF